MAFIIYELFRYQELFNDNCVPLHPLFYKHINSQRHCPCGSHKKYKDCCKQSAERKKIKIDDYPDEADFTLDIDCG